MFLKATRPHVVAVSTSAGQGSRMIMDMLVNRMSGQNGQPRTGLLADAHREFENQRYWKKDSSKAFLQQLCWVLFRVVVYFVPRGRNIPTPTSWYLLFNRLIIISQSRPR